MPKPGAAGADAPNPGADGVGVPKPGVAVADAPKPGADGVDVPKPGTVCSFVPSCKPSELSESPDTIILILSTTISKLNSKPSGPQTLYAPTPAGFSTIFPLDC